jgi:hypothetical protein
MNAINVISPYRHHGMWVFDEPRVGLMQEPFVAGADTWIDRVVADIPNAEKGFTLIFSGTPFPGHQYRLDWRRAEVDALIELDLSTNGKDYPNILRPHATVVVYGMSSSESTLPTLWLMRNSITLRSFSSTTSVLPIATPALPSSARSQPPDPHVARSLPLDDIALAHELSERGEVIDNIVLGIG